MLLGTPRRGLAALPITLPPYWARPPASYSHGADLLSFIWRIWPALTFKPSKPARSYTPLGILLKLGKSMSSLPNLSLQVKDPAWVALLLLPPTMSQKGAAICGSGFHRAQRKLVFPFRCETKTQRTLYRYVMARLSNHFKKPAKPSKLTSF